MICRFCKKPIALFGDVRNEVTGASGYYRDLVEQDECCDYAPETVGGQFLHYPEIEKMGLRSPSCREDRHDDCSGSCDPMRAICQCECHPTDGAPGAAYLERVTADRALTSEDQTMIQTMLDQTTRKPAQDTVSSPELVDAVYKTAFESACRQLGKAGFDWSDFLSAEQIAEILELERNCD